MFMHKWPVIEEGFASIMFLILLTCFFTPPSSILYRINAVKNLEYFWSMLSYCYYYFHNCKRKKKEKETKLIRFNAATMLIATRY